MKKLLKCGRSSFGGNQRNRRFPHAFLSGGFCRDSGKCERLKPNWFLIAGVITMAVLLCGATLHKAGPSGAATVEWNPTKGPPAGTEYVGDRVCSGCHVSEGKTYSRTPMAQAAALAPDADILRNHPRLSFRQGPYSYQISRRGKEFIYSVSNERRTISVPIIWAFGRGAAGQTYVFRWNGVYFQSRVSFFNDIQGLDLTMGSPRGVPPNIEFALGARMDTDGVRACVVCHTTGAVIGGNFLPAKAVPGVHCEACHGPGGSHVAAVSRGRWHEAQASIFNPGRLSPGQLDDFCGSCHRTWEQVELMGLVGILNVRFQPYRLQNSRCWSPTDMRISCLSCHNPHENLVTDTGFYDSKCLRCHPIKGIKESNADSSSQAPACPVSPNRCIKCHMPRYEFPGGHYAFTDHDIRIVRPGAPYPG
jgi:hypothetical protein